MALALPNNLFAMALSRFDKLVDEGEIIYGTSHPEYIERDGFESEFRISLALGPKPLFSRHASGRSKTKEPFVNPDPNFVLTSVGPSHILELNKYCVFRPMLVLHTEEYVEQEEDLDASDLAAG